MGFTISWLPPPSEDHNGVIQGYLIGLTEESTGRQFSLTSTNTNLTVESLIRPYNNYSVSLSAVTLSSGPVSSPVMVTTLEDGELYFDQSIYMN